MSTVAQDWQVLLISFFKKSNNDKESIYTGFVGFLVVTPGHDHEITDHLSSTRSAALQRHQIKRDLFLNVVL